MKVLFTDGDWRLVGRATKPFTADIQHHCTRPNGGKYWWYYAHEGCCGVCHETIPVEIIGLRNLHRWNR